MRALLTCFGCIWVFSSNLFSQSITMVAPKVGDVPPPLQLSRIVQGPKLGKVCWDKLRGKVVVLEFWDTQCGPCIRAIPHLNSLVETFAEKPVVFLSVSDDNPDRLKQFVRRKPIETWLALDGPFDPTKTAFGIWGIPTIFIVDREGKIAAITHPATLQTEHLDEILAGKRSSLPLPKPYPGEDQRASVTNPDSPPTQVSVSIRGPIAKPKGGAFNFRSWNDSHTVFEAKKAYVRDVLAAFFGVNRKLVFEKTRLPDDLYDFRAAAPIGRSSQLQSLFIAIIKTTLDISVQLKDRELDVYAVTVCSTNVTGLRRSDKRGGGGQIVGGFGFGGVSMDAVAAFFENYFDRPVVNETKLAGLWGVDLKWQMSEAELLEGRLDDAVWRFMRTNRAAIIAGDFPKELRGEITGLDFKLLRAELVKPDAQQFRPKSGNIIKAAREQLGLEIKPAKRNLQVIEVRSVN